MVAAKVLASEEGGHGTTVNTLAPGLVLTDRVRDVGGRMAAAAGRDFDEHLTSTIAEIPMGRLRDPEELGDPCAYLCSPRAGFVNSQVIVMDGGSNRSV